MQQKREFRAWKPALAVAVASLVFFALTAHPMEQRLVAMVFALTVVLWATETFPIGITSLLAMVLLSLVAGISEKAAFAGLGDPVIPLFIGSLILAKAMEVTGLSKRVAISILRKPWATKTPGRLMLTLTVVTACFSLFLSNLATTAMMLPICLSILTAIGAKGEKSAYAAGMLLAISFAANVSVGTPIGTPPDLIAVEDVQAIAGRKISFAQWMAFGIPITLLLVGVVYIVLMLMFGRDAPTRQVSLAESDEQAQIQGWSPGERATAAVLVIAILLWLAPMLAPYIEGPAPGAAAFLENRLSANIVGVLAALLLFFLPAKGMEGGHPITWRDAVGIDWGVVLLMAAGISLGQAVFETGLAGDLGNALASATGAETVWSITALGIGIAILMSEFASNTATATALLPVMAGLAEGAGVNPAGPILGTALGASLGVALPFSTGTNALVFSTGRITPGQMLKSALVLDVVGFFVVLGCLRVCLPLLGMA